MAKVGKNHILYENGNYWIASKKDAYTVYCCGITHSTSDSSYSKTQDGLSIAKARCDYLAKRDKEKIK